MQWKMKNPAHSFTGTNLVFQLIKNLKLKKKFDDLELVKEKREHFWYRLFYLKKIFFNICILS